MREKYKTNIISHLEISKLDKRFFNLCNGKEGITNRKLTKY